MGKKNSSIMNIITMFGVVAVIVFMGFVVWYMLVAIPQQKKQAEITQARNRATAECQTMLDKTRIDYNKAVSTVSEMRKKGFGYMVNNDFADIEKEWSHINTPAWFQGCIARNMQNYGF